VTELVVMLVVNLVTPKAESQARAFGQQNSVWGQFFSTFKLYFSSTVRWTFTEMIVMNLVKRIIKLNGVWQIDLTRKL